MQSDQAKNSSADHDVTPRPAARQGRLGIHSSPDKKARPAQLDLSKAQAITCNIGVILSGRGDVAKSFGSKQRDPSKPYPHSAPPFTVGEVAIDARNEVMCLRSVIANLQAELEKVPLLLAQAGEDGYNANQDSVDAVLNHLDRAKERAQQAETAAANAEWQVAQLQEELDRFQLLEDARFDAGRRLSFESGLWDEHGAWRATGQSATQEEAEHEQEEDERTDDEKEEAVGNGGQGMERKVKGGGVKQEGF